MAEIYSNFNSGTTTDNPLLIGATTINSAALASLPAVTAPDYMWLVLDPTASAGAPEVVKVTAHTAAATSATIARGQQSSSARQHAVGTTWIHAVTKTDMEDLPHRLLTAKGSLLSASAANTSAVLAVGTNGKVLTAASGESTGLKWQYPTLPVAVVQRAAVQSIPNNTVTAVEMDTEDLDPLGWWAGGNPTRITPTIAGWYEFTISTNWTSDTDITAIRQFAAKNADLTVQYAELRFSLSGSHDPSFVSVTVPILLNGSSDYVEMYVSHANTSAGANDLLARMSAKLVYPT